MARERAEDEQYEENDSRQTMHSAGGAGTDLVGRGDQPHYAGHDPGEDADEDPDNDHLSLAGDEPLLRRPRTKLGSSTGPNTPDEVPTR